MRKTSYVVTFIFVAATLILTAFTSLQPTWLIVTYSDLPATKVTLYYGLSRHCQLKVIDIRGDEGERFSYTDYKCRVFPTRADDACDKENSSFCAAWTSAGYAVELSIGFASLALLAILFGVSTGSRRRRIWRAVAGLVILQTLFQIVAFGLVTEMYRSSKYPTFERARPGIAYVLNLTAWIAGVCTTVGIIATGVAADKGHKWAAGNRAYRRIQE